jgi:XTP/dITP diphosphohydrolase
LSAEEDTLKEHKRIVYFATKNNGKYVEAAQIASEYGVELAHLSLEKHEVQDDDLSKIASFAAEEAVRESKIDCVVAEDAGFFVEALQGFPGPYSSYVYSKLGVEGILKLMKDVTERDAYFCSALAYSQEGHSFCFEGKVNGTVSLSPRGARGFGFDPIFIPVHGDGRTFAEMEISEKNRFSHRAMAFRNFFKWLKSQRQQK